MTLLAALYLTLFAWALSIALGMLGLLMIVRVSGGQWVNPWIPAAERVAGSLPALAVAVLPVLLLVHVLYPWAGARADLTAESAHQIAVARPWLNVPFFVVRAALYFGAWYWVLARIRRNRGTGMSAAGLVILAFTLTFASIDWLVSLTPGWFSTMYGVVYFAGGFLAALGALAVLARHGGEPERTKKLGTMLLTAVVFWFYVAFSQYLVFWIAGIPRDIAWYVPRSRGGWGVLSLALVLLQFALPMLALLPGAVRRNARAVALVGGWLVLTHLAEACWLVLPSVLDR